MKRVCCLLLFALLLLAALVSCEAEKNNGGVQIIQPSPTARLAKTPAPTFDATKSYAGQLASVSAVNKANNDVTLQLYSYERHETGTYENAYYDITSLRQSTTLPLAGDVVILMKDLFTRTTVPSESEELEVSSDYFFENALEEYKGEGIYFFVDIDNGQITHIEVFWEHYFGN